MCNLKRLQKTLKIKKNSKIKNKGLIDAWVVLELSFVPEQLIQNNESKINDVYK